MKSFLSAFAAGLIFGLGLLVSGMANPAKVLNFLDIAGTWDPTLIAVMGGALVTTALGYRLVFVRKAPLLASSFHVPVQTVLDRRLLGGAVTFGLGWGLAGICPGPALVALIIAGAPVLYFVVAMIIGMVFADAVLVPKAAPHK